MAVYKNGVDQSLPLAGGIMAGNISMAGAETVDGVDVSAHAADLAAHHLEKQETLRTGEYFSTFPAIPNQGNEALTANRLFAIPFYVARTRTYDRIAISVATEQAASAIRLGIYNNGTNFAPGTLLLDAGVVDTTSTGIKAITINQQLTKGHYWLAVYNQVGAVGVDRMVVTGEVFGNVATSLILFYAMWYYDGTYGVLPDPFPTPTDKFNHTSLVVALRLLTND